MGMSLSHLYDTPARAFIYLCVLEAVMVAVLIVAGVPATGTIGSAVVLAVIVAYSYKRAHQHR